MSSPKHQRFNTYHSQTLQKPEKKGMLPTSFYEAKTNTKKLQASISDKHKWKILNKVVANQIQQYIKRIIYHDQMEFIPGLQGFFNIHKLIKVIQHIKKLKNKKHMISSIDVEKAFEKIQHSFMIKLLQKGSIEGTYHNIIKAIYDKHAANIILSGKNSKHFL